MADTTILTQSSMDPHTAAETLLLKIALEGKGFQRARKGVEASRFSAQESSSDGTPPLRAEDTTSSAPPGTVQFTVWEMNVQRIAITLQTENTAASLTLTRAQFQTVQTTVQPEKKDPLVLDLEGTGPWTTGRKGARVFRSGR